jgi:hypothetical protein
LECEKRSEVRKNKYKFHPIPYINEERCREKEELSVVISSQTDFLFLSKS